jgi:hypothetical protein
MRHFEGLRLCALIALAAGALVVVTGASAGPGVSTTTPFTYVGTNPCTGEPLTGTGEIHSVTRDDVSASGNIQFNLTTTVNGLKAVTPTGKKYVVQETFSWNFTISRAVEESFDIVAHYVRVGEDGSFILGDDFYEYLKTHITANANGVPTASHVSASDSADPCQ